MKKVIIMSTVLVSTALFSTSVFAAAWSVPINERVVQKGTQDTASRIYNSIQPAIDSCKNTAPVPTATNPCVVKVMPGVFDLGTTSLQMKEFVYLDGSGSDSTIITSSNIAPYTGADNCDTGTVIMANDSSIRAIKIVNKPNTAGDNAAALVFKNVKATAENVSILTDDVSSFNGNNIGVCSYGTLANAKLNNVKVEVNSDSSQSNTIMKMAGSSLTITNSTLVASSPTGSAKMLNTAAESGATGTTTVVNCLFEGTGDTVQAIYSENVNTTIINSVITMNTTAGTAPTFFANSNLSIVNTKFSSNSTVGVIYSGLSYGVAKISNSILHGYGGDLQGTNARLLNNSDENLNTITNQ